MVKADTGTGTLGKAMDVVGVIANTPTPLRFRDLAERIDQPRATLHRHVSNLIDEGLIEVRQDQTYGLGIRLLQLAALSWSGSQFRKVAEPHLLDLHNKTSETVHLGVLRGIDVIYLDKVESAQAVRMHSQIGNASPCYCTGVGKAALSALPEDAIGPLLKQIQFHAFTSSTVTSASQLANELETIRQTGLAFDREEHEPGIHCVAAPVFSQNRTLVAGVSVTAPVYRVSQAQLEDWGDLIRQTASSIMDDIATRMGPKP